MKRLKLTNVCFYAIVFLSALLFTSLSFAEDSPRYRFVPEKPLNYDFSIKGGISYENMGISQNFNVEARGALSLETLGEKEGVYSVRLVPSETLIKLNEMVMEDMTGNKGAPSQLISSSILDIRKNGEVVSSREISEGILNISQILRLLPAFPEKVHTGKRWQQSLSSFSLPGMPMCNLEFNYMYLSQPGETAKVRLIANQSIKEQQQDGGLDVSFTGKNSSNGEFSFCNEEGEIKDFKGNFNLVLNVAFVSPPGPEGEKSTQKSMPVKIAMKLNITLERTKAE